MQAEWEEFFSGLTLDVMRDARSPEEISTEAEAIATMLRVQPGARVLDIPCGAGIHSLALAAGGFRLEGLDISAALLDQARSTALRRGLSLEWHLRDMRDLPWHSEFDGAICMWGSFGYFDDAGNAEFLRAVAQTLRPGARFLIDTPLVETVLPGFHDSDWTNIGPTTLLEKRRYYHESGRLERAWTMMQGNHVEKRVLSMRLYTYSELCRIAREAGFSTCEGYSSLSMEPFSLGADRCFFVVRKAGGE